MIAENTVNDLIEMGWGLASRDFDRKSFGNWKSRALGYLISYFGPHHAYSKYFEKYVRTAERKSALAGAGILVAAKEQLTKRRIDPT
jgi:hypothetical protein